MEETPNSIGKAKVADVVSVLILTLNEESDLPRCLDSVRWSDDVVVLDSFSTDKTLQVAHERGARIVQRRFDDWSSHLNWAVTNIQFKHPWVYYSDADEVVTRELGEEMNCAVRETSRPFVAYRVRYRNFFHDRWIRHCGIYPVWLLRLFRPCKVRWERAVNPLPIVDGQTGDLENHFHHYSFSKGFDAWFDKHNRYSRSEALESIKHLQGGAIDWVGVFAASDPTRRRRAIKELSFRLPCRPALRFFYMYFLRLGFLDGWQGLTYCTLLSIYEYMIVLKMRELRRREKHLSL